MASLRETIREISRNYVESGNGFIIGQCLSAVGWVDGTVPNTSGIVELPMTDVAGADLACGIALTGKRPILVIRFQDFLMLNGNAIVNFAAKRKEIFQESCPVFVRALAKEGGGTGNSHSGKLHSTFMHFPGLRLYAPMTPGEYKTCWYDFIVNDDPAICFEHRASFDNENEIEDITTGEKITIIAVSQARIAAKSVASKNGYDYFGIVMLKPFTLRDDIIKSLKKTGKGLVVDTGFEICGASHEIAYRYMLETGVPVHSLGLKDVSVGCRPGSENLTPNTTEIEEKCLSIA